MSAQEPSGEDKPHKKSPFTATHWSDVLSAQNSSSPESDEALENLCRTYWYPLYAYIRSRGNAPDASLDLTQGYFCQLLANRWLRDVHPAKGKFRSFLLKSLNHFLANQHRHDTAQKRGGGQVLLPLEPDAEDRYQKEPANPATPEQLFERRWAMTLIELIFTRLREEYAARDRVAVYEVLKQFLSGDEPGTPYVTIAEKLGMTENAVKAAVKRMRERFRELLREEMRRIVTDPTEVDTEIRYLFSVLSP